MYSVLKACLYVVFKLIFRCKVSGRDNIPLTGSVIIAANHLSSYDPPLLGAFVPRPIHFMAKAELFDIPLLGWLIRKINAFPVRRGAADRAAVRTMIDLLEHGCCMGLFPEGTRSKDGLPGQPEPGVAMFAVKTGATVVPTAIIGTDGRRPFEVRFGRPLTFAKGKVSKERLEEISHEIMDEIAMLFRRQ